MRLDRDTVLHVLDAAYSDDDGRWAYTLIERLAAIAGARAGGFVRYATTSDGGRFRVDISEVVQVGSPLVAWTDDVARALEREPSAPDIFGRSHAGTLSHKTGLGHALASYPPLRNLWAAPVVDVLGVTSHDASGRGVQIAIGLERIDELSGAERALLLKLGTHVGAGDRLRAVAQRDRVARADAVLDARGKLLHATAPAARDDDARDVRDGIARRDHARRRGTDPAAALEVWRGLVAGTWSIVDHLDTDGKRLVLAIQNAPAVEPRAGLSAHDHRVAALAAAGSRDREIAYELGISAAAVASALRRARGALGVRTRAELAARWRALASNDHQK